MTGLWNCAIGFARQHTILGVAVGVMLGMTLQAAMTGNWPLVAMDAGLMVAYAAAGVFLRWWAFRPVFRWIDAEMKKAAK